MSSPPSSSAGQGLKSVIAGRLFVTLPVPKATKDLSNQVMIVTGANVGLGFESCLHLSRLGLGKLIIAVRRIDRGIEAKKKILHATGRKDSSIDVWALDMEDHRSIAAFTDRVSHLDRLDGVLANAGILTRKFEIKDGYEKTLTVNVVGPLLLFALLLPTMERSYRKTGYKCRFVVPNSALHHMAPLQDLNVENGSIIDRLNDPKLANMDLRYNLSKLLVLYMVRALAESCKSCIINTPNPSFCKSNLAQESQDKLGFRIFEKVMARTTEEGSRTLVHAILADEDTNGQYLSNCRIESPSSSVTEPWGQQMQKRVYKDLCEHLELVHPGISQAFH